MLTVEALQRTLHDMSDFWVLQKNDVGNLMVLDGWQGYIGFIDLRTGIFEENEKDTACGP